MPVREISTRISLDGEKQFRQAIAEADREMRVMNSELKKLASEYEVSGNAQQYFSGKSRILKNEINQQKQIVQALEKAVEDSAEGYGAGSKQVAGYKIELNNAYVKLQQLEKQLKNSDREAKDFGQNSGRVGRQIRNGIGDAAEEADEKLKDLMKTMQQDVGSIRDMAAVQIITEVGSGVIDTVNQVVSFVESTRDYRTRMARTKQSVESAGLAWDEMQALLFEAAALTGDMDSTQEALANLARVGMGDAWVKTAMDLLGGASILWQDTLKLEGLADGLQESIATGTATGQFGELLERLGIELDTYNAAMEGLNEAERATASLNFLGGDSGLIEAKLEYERTNEELLKARQAQMELDQKWAELAAELEPITTALIQSLTDVVEDFAGWIKWAKENYGFLFDPDKAKEELRNYDPEFAGALENGQLDTFGGTIKYIEQQITGNEEQAKEAGKQAAEHYAQGAEEKLKQIDMNTIWWEMQNAYVDYGTSGVEELLKKYEVSEDQKTMLINMMTQLGIDEAEAFDIAYQSGMSTANKNAYTSGKNFMTELANGINANADLPVNAISDAIARMSAAVNGSTVIYGGGSGYALGGTGGQVINLTANVTMDGQKVGTLTANSVSAAQGAKAARNTKIM